MDEELTPSNVVVFPVINKRYDVNDIEIMPDEIAEKVKMIRMTYFSDIADEILDHVVRSISLLNLNTDKDAGQITSTDVILLKESIISMMCKLSGTSHPLHKIAKDVIIINSLEDDADDMYFKYTFKDDECIKEKKEEV